MVGSVRFGIGAGIGSLIALMPTDSALPMLLTMGACSLVSVLFYIFLTAKNLK